ncbi:uncharacterized protein LOC100120533 isoform X2 [Nasonia vitripennis]|uniref:Uncharacterized protein n=1 Tax=Nasonia vitripennis TaxID=7425 RepID=A0A7M7J2C2_NASVI|nr:uncharacterized protein LOC100120533 isoform X2 [Nasonia vitripennis]
MRMHIAETWAILLLAHTSTLLLVGSQYVGPFPGQRLTQQQQHQAAAQAQELGYSDKRASTMAEPTCEELRAMWRYSKRQSRAAESTNELPVYRDPFSYNVWEAYPSRSPSTGYREEYTGPARSRGAGGAPIYGKLVHKAPAGSRLRNGMPDRARAFEEVARLYGTVNRQPPSQRRRLTSFRVGGGPVNPNLPQAGSFQHLKEIILTERARELQRRAEEMAARAAVLKEMTSGERMRQSNAHESRNANFLSSLQGSYQSDPKNYDFAQAQYVPDIGQAFSKSDHHYAREYMLRR